MGNPSLRRFIQRNIYAMKRHYGARIDFYRVLSSETDHLTGEKTVVKEVHRIRRAPVLPYDMRRTVVQTISIISADKQFVYGGSFDAARREIIIDSRDLPKGLEIRPEDYFVFQNERWDVVDAQKFEYDAGWVVAVKMLPGMPPYELRDIVVTQDLALIESAEGFVGPEVPINILQSLGLDHTHSVIKNAGSGVNASVLNLTQSVQVEVN